jgi:hypothetical protein
MAETMRGFNCCCPLRCKGNRSLGKFLTHEDAHGRVIHHLNQSALRWLNEEDGASLIAENPDCIWEDDVEISHQNYEDDAERDRSRSRSRPPAKGKGKDKHGGQHGGNHGGHHGRGGHQGSSRSGHSGGQRREEQLVRRTSERIMDSLDANQADQRNKVFQFAKVLGKCEAVIRTACTVARQAASCFEDFTKFDFRFAGNE